MYIFTSTRDVLGGHLQCFHVVLSFFSAPRFTNAEFEEVQASLKTHGQEHLLQFWPQLTEEQRCQLMTDLRYIDYARTSTAFKEATEEGSGDPESLDDLLEPIPADRQGSVSRCSPEKLEAYRNEGGHYG